MLSGAHFIVGNAAVQGLGRVNGFFLSPLIAFGIGFISHHLADLVPHLDSNVFHEEYEGLLNWPLKVWVLLIGEAVIIAGLFFWLTPSLLQGKNLLITLMASLGSIFPDIISSLPSQRGKLLKRWAQGRSYLSFHKKHHYHLRTTKLSEKITAGSIQAVFIIIVYLILRSVES